MRERPATAGARDQVGMALERGQPLRTMRQNVAGALPGKGGRGKIAMVTGIF